MDAATTAEGPGRERLETVAAAFRAGAEIYLAKGSPLYSALCAAGAEDPQTVALAAEAQPRAQPAYHLFASAHYLLLEDPGHPLARFFPTLAEDPAPPQEAFPAFKRFCLDRRDEIAAILASRTVQTTYVERCMNLMPIMSLAADLAGEPLNLIELGCSAGVLLTFDKYAYELPDGRRIGPTNAPLVLQPRVDGGQGGRALRVPEIGRRIGLDLRPVDAAVADERRWILALTFPEFREQQARLAVALDTAARSGLTLIAGDALETLPRALAMAAGPLCIFHSACLYYWTAETKAALDELLRQASRERVIFRVGLEPPEAYNTWAKGASTPAGPRGRLADAEGEITLTRYDGGEMSGRVVAYTQSNASAFHWVDQEA